MLSILTLSNFSPLVFLLSLFHSVRFVCSCYRRCTVCRGECANNYKLQQIRFCFSGPTTAAGAIGCALVIADHLNANKHKNAKHGTAEDFALNNDSFNFYRLLSDGKYHIITGHTGTNVMDLHILYIPPPNSYAHKL